MAAKARTLTLATAGVAAGFALMSRRAISNADALAKAARNAGLSVNAYQELAHVFERAGSNGGVLSRSVQTLQRRILDARRGSTEAVDAFQDLGLSWKSLERRSPERALLQVMESLRGVDSVGRRTALSQVLLGRAGRDLGNILTQSAADIEAQRRRLRDLGGVIDPYLTGRAEALEDAITDATTVVKSQFTSALLESLGPARDWDDVIKSVGENTRSGTKFLLELVGRIWEWRGALGAVAAVWTAASISGWILTLGQLTGAVVSLGAAFKGAAVGALAMTAAANPKILAGIVAAVAIGAALPSSGERARGRIGRLESQHQDLSRRRSEQVSAGYFLAARETSQQLKRIAAEIEEQTKIAANPNRRRYEDILEAIAAGFKKGLDPIKKALESATDFPVPVTPPPAPRVNVPPRRGNALAGVLGDLREGAVNDAISRVVARLADQRINESVEGTRGVRFEELLEQVDAKLRGGPAAAATEKIDFREVGEEFKDSLRYTLANTIATGDWGNVGDALVDALGRAFATRTADALVDLVEPFIDGIFNALETSIGSSASKAGADIFSNVGEIFSGIFSGIGGLFKGIFSLFSFHDGGRVPGRPGQEIPALLEAGELVVPADQVSGALAPGVSITLQLTGDVTQATRRAVREDMPEIAAGVYSQFREEGVI